MADRSDIGFKAGKAAGQAQVKKDDMMDKTCQSAQETGEKVKDMAQGAADTMKNAMGMGDDTGHATTARTTATKR